MKITNRVKEPAPYIFAQTAFGEVFTLGEHTYMAIEPGWTQTDDVPFNAVLLSGLSDGYLENIPHSSVIIPLKAELVVERE
jgi:hypothetical protein